MVRETRHLWVGNLPDNIREDRIREHFKRYGRVQNVKLLGRTENPAGGTCPASVSGSGICAAVAFMDIKSASKAHNAEHVLDERTLTTEYYEPAAIPSAAGAPSAGSSPAGSGYSGSSSSATSAPAPPSTTTTTRYHIPGSEESAMNSCAIAATAAAPATWRGTNDSASEYCRRGNTPSTYGRTGGQHRWYGGGGESTPSTPGGATETGGRARRRSGSGSSRSDSSSEPSDASRASTPAHLHHPHHPNHRQTPHHSHQWSSTAGGRPLAICVRNLPTRSTDSSLKDGLYHEYKKHGKVVWVKVVGQNADRYAVVRFKKPSDVEKALEVSQDKLFFGCKISVAPHQSCDEDAESAKPYETDIDEYHPKATRTLFIGNLEKEVTQQQLREKFKHFGRIVEVDIKKGSGGGSGYAFCQYASISSVVEAIRAMDGEHVGGSRVKLGFGKPVATTCVWVDGLTEHTEKQVLSAVSRCGTATSVCVDRAAGAALVHFEQVTAAGAAVRELRRVAAAATATEPDLPRLCVDYASRECQEAFYEQLEKHGGAAALMGSERLSGDLGARYIPSGRHEALRYDSVGARSRASSYGRGASRNPRFSTLEHYDPADYAADRRYRVYDEIGSTPPPDDVPYEERLQSVVVSPHRARKHRRDSSPEDRKHSKERHRSSGGSVRRSRSGSRCGERHSGRRRHRRRRDGSRCSRTGTPLRDEPDALPAEPRRPPRDRPPLPMSLPLPKFAAQLLRTTPSTPRPNPAPAPASPPRPPSASSSSAGSAPHSPSLEERIRSLDEKYEKWSGSRALFDTPDRSRLRHRLLDVDINEVKPSDVVRSLLAKRSVFDEDSERLEGATRAPSPGGSPRSRPSPTCLSRTLRYPFPAHPTHSTQLLQFPLPQSEVDVESSDRPADPRLNRTERLYQPEKLGKFNESDYRLESRFRLRTPSTDKPQTESCDRKLSPKTEKDRLDSDRESNKELERRRRDSLYNENRFSFDVDTKDIKDGEKNCVLSMNKRTKEENIDMSLNKTSTHSDRSDESIQDQSQNSADSSNIDRLEENSGQDFTQTLLKQLVDDKTYEKFELQIEKQTSSSKEHVIKSETNSKPSLTYVLDKQNSSGKEHVNKSETYGKPGLTNVIEKQSSLTKDHGIKSETNSNPGLIHVLEKQTSLGKEPVIKCESNKPSVTHILHEVTVKLENKSKSEKIDFHSKIDGLKCKNIFGEQHIKSEAVEELSGSQMNCIKSSKAISDFCQALVKDSEKSAKEIFHNQDNLEIPHAVKSEKENLIDISEKNKRESKNLFPECRVSLCKRDIATQETESEKLSFHKDRAERDSHEHDKEKYKNNKSDRLLYKPDKDKKNKDDYGKAPEEKLEKNKSEKDPEKIHRHKNRDDRDCEKSKTTDDKLQRHEQHKKDKFEKEKRRNSMETENLNKLKKDDKHKHEKNKRDSVDTKREVKKEDSVKVRKSSRDETVRDLCRKDSTDSCASKASHDSNKVKDLDSTDVKEDQKPGFKLLNDFFLKQKVDNKEPLPKSDLLQTENAKIKHEVNKGAEQSGDHIKPKHEIEPIMKTRVEPTEKQRHYSVDSPTTDGKRKERLNSCSSLPSNIGHKRRISSQDNLDLLSEDLKKHRNDNRCPEKKDSKNVDRHKTTKFNKCHFAKIIESKTKDDKKNQVKPPDDPVIELRDCEKDKKTNEKINLAKSSSDGSENEKSKSEDLHNDLDFLATLELRSSEEDEKQKALRKEMKEKKRIQQLQQIQQLQMQQDAMQQSEHAKVKEDKKPRIDDRRRESFREKRLSIERKSKEEKSENNKKKSRKHMQSSDTSDSDEPKKHSIFDIVDDGPTYISMYDKVKARSCKNMQKQEEEKRQEKIKAKFSQLKQSRAKREEKKRSSWDEDSDSDPDRRKSQRATLGSSSEDEDETHIKNCEEVNETSLLNFNHKMDSFFGVPSNEEELHNKLSRKNSRTRIISDTSDEEGSKRSISKSPNFRNESNKDSLLKSGLFQTIKDGNNPVREVKEEKIKKNSLLSLFGKSDSDDSKLKLNFGSEHKFIDFSSESESTMLNRQSEIRKKHKKKQKKHKFSFSDDEKKNENKEPSTSEDSKRKQTQKMRRHSNKKEKRKEKIRDSFDTDDAREEKTKYNKKNKKSPGDYFEAMSEASSNNVIRKEGKMEDIFGPLSDESDREIRDTDKRNAFSTHNYDSMFCLNDHEDLKLKEKEEKRRRDKRRKERRYFVKEDENSLDIDAASKAIEAELIADTLTKYDNHMKMDLITECDIRHENDHLKSLSDIALPEKNYQDTKHFEKLRRDSKDKKKKKKKSKEEKQNRKDPSIFNHDKSDKTDCISMNVTITPNPVLSEIPLPKEKEVILISEEIEEIKSILESQSLPRLTDSPPLPDKDCESIISKNKNIDTIVISNIDSDAESEFEEKHRVPVDSIPMPPPIENIVQDIGEVPLPDDPEPPKSEQSNSDNFNSPFSSIDDNMSENAVRSISNLEKTVEQSNIKIDSHNDKIEEKDEKQRAIISQEETEDAVAALLGESFGGKESSFENCYEENVNDSTHRIETAPVESQNMPEEDAEEMRQAVQNLNASEMEIKPDTPVSDNDLLLIDTDTEEPDENTQDAIERLPINIIATNQSLNVNTEQAKHFKISNMLPKQKEPLPQTNDEIIKSNEIDIPYSSSKREIPPQITSTATPVITSWTLTNNKINEPQILNIQKNSLPRDVNESKPTHITANIVQIKTSQNQNLQIGNTLRPMISPSRVTAPYQVLNHIIRPQTPNMQPPTIKIPPEPHILYQKPQGIVISPRLGSDTRLLSPKAVSQGETLPSPRLTNMAILSTSPQSFNTVGMTSNTMQTRSPGQVTVVRMQQPPLSPIQAMHMPHMRTMLSPNRPNSVLVQTQGTPIHFNRLPVAPVLAPISKQINPNNSASIVQQNKNIVVSSSSIIHQQKIITGDCRKNDQRSVADNMNDSSKITLSSTGFSQSTNPTVLAQNRLITLQNSVHLGNLNSPIHLSNKVLMNNVSQHNEKKETHIQKPEQHNHIPCVSTPMLHITGVNPSSASIIQNSPKSVMCTLQDNAISRSQGSNVIHTLNSHRILTTPISNVVHMDSNKITPSVLSMATIRAPTVVTKLDSSSSLVGTTASLTNVVMTPLLLKTTSATGTIRLNKRNETDMIDNRPHSLHNHLKNNEIKFEEKRISPNVACTLSDSLEKQKETKNNAKTEILSPTEVISKGETDFEELLKDKTNEIKVTNNPDKKLEVNVGKNLTLFSKNVPFDSKISDIDFCMDQSKHTETILQSKDNEINKCDIRRQDENTKEFTFDKPPHEAISESKNQETHIFAKTENVNDNIPNSTICNEDQINSESQTSNDPDDEKPLKLLIEPIVDSVKETKDLDIEMDNKTSQVESVIKKVDVGRDENLNEKKNEDCEVLIEKFLSDSSIVNVIKADLKNIENKIENVEVSPIENYTDVKVTVSNKRGGRNGRGKKTERNHDRIQTRQISKPSRGTSKRGRGRAKVDKKLKNIVNNIVNNLPGDIYDFHEDSGDETTTSPQKTEARPRLILTIKSPLSGNSNAIATSTLSITSKDPLKSLEVINKEDKTEDFVSPSVNTRKSRRLLEKDVQKNIPEDSIEDMIKGPNFQNKQIKEANKKKPTRQKGKVNNKEKVVGSDTRKSPRGTKRVRDRSLSDASLDSSDEKTIKTEIPIEPKIQKMSEPEMISPVRVEPNLIPLTPKPSVPVVNSSPSLPTPIMKPPKKMISEISAKLAGAFEASLAPVRTVVASVPMACEANNHPAEAEKQTPIVREPRNPDLVLAAELKPAATGESHARRLVESVPSGLMPVGATEAADARVLSPALPHRPPSSHRPADRATPILIRTGEGELVGGCGGAVATGSGSRLRAAYAGTASLPLGAHHPPPAPLHSPKQVAIVSPHQQPAGAGARVNIASIPTVSPQGQVPLGDGMYPHFSHQHYQMYQQHFHATQHENRTATSPYIIRNGVEEGSEAPTPVTPIELLRRPPSARVPRPAHSPAPDRHLGDRHIMYAVGCGRSPPPAHGTSRLPGALPPQTAPGPPHASQVPREADSLQMLLRRYPVMWQGLLALKNDSAAVQMHFVGGNPAVAGNTLPRHTDGSTPPLRIAQRMRLEPAQLDQVHRKMKLNEEHCILLALPCGRDHMDVLLQSTNLTTGFITYLQRKQAAGIVNVAPPGHHQAFYTVHIFPSCDFANENLNRIAPDLMHRVADIAHLLIVIATV